MSALQARSSATIAPGGVLADVVSGPPLTIRKVQTDRADVCHLCLVGSAAGPLPGDDVRLDLTVSPGACAEVSATGACIAQGREGSLPSSLSSTIDVAEGARLFAEPPPLIACFGSTVHVSLAMTLASTARISWREVVILGRSAEPAGDVTLSWEVYRSGEPVLVHSADLVDPALREWPGMLDGRRVLASLLINAPDLELRTFVASPTAVRQRIDAQTVLITVIGDDAATVQRELTALAGRVP